MPVNEVLRQRTRGLAASLNSHRVLVYSLVSTVAMSAAIANALKNHSNFYSVAIYLSKSSRSVLVLANFGFLLSLLCGFVAQQIFFGSLRAPEVERLYDRLWFFVTESLLAFTIFRDDFDIPFGLMFGFLLFVKTFHWLASDRIEWMDQRPYPGPPALFHVRMSFLFMILWTTDLLMFLIAIEHTLAHGVGGMVLFASEYAILMASVINTSAKYILYTYDLRRAGQRGGENAPPWENKSMWVFYIELATDFLKLTTYLIFFTLIIVYYGLPLNILRDVYITARSFITRLRALHRYQTATRNMDERYPNATEEEMITMNDRTCIICREEMVLQSPAEGNTTEASTAQAPSDGPNTTPKKLPCGHIFHFHCLRSWLERQQSCPTCRRTVMETDPPAGAARVPQAGAMPQQPNFFGIPGPQQAPQPNNPLGFLGRLFGAAAQPPIVPGQFAHGQIPPIPQYAAQAAGPPHPGVIIQYHIQYLVPRQQQQLQAQPHPLLQPPQQQQQQQQQQQLQPQPQPSPPPRPRPPQPVQPAPQFAGFYGPGGVWQPWGMDARWFGQGPQIPGQPPDPAQAPSNLTPTATSTDAAPSSSTQPHSHQPPTHTPEGAVESDDDSRMPPREAALLAALQRANATPAGQQKTLLPLNQPSTSVSDGPTESQPIQSEEIQAAATVLPTPHISEQLAPNSVQGPDSRLEIPMMIPLYDNEQLPSPQGPLHLSAYGSPQTRGHSPIFRPQGVRGQSQSSAGSHAQPPVTRPGAPLNHQTRSPHRIPISQLPPTLTDEQLARMDRMTREAIDERLRVLEGVSGAVYRCIDDLMRMRSALPSPRQTTPTQATTPGVAGPINMSAPSQHSTSQVKDASSELTPSLNPLITVDDSLPIIADVRYAGGSSTPEVNPERITQPGPSNIDSISAPVTERSSDDEVEIP